MYVWFISLNANNNPLDQGIWQSMDGGGSWVSINDTGIVNCGDLEGCGVENGAYNLELLAVPNCPNGTQTCTGNPTDLYAGAVNIYKCSITAINPTCAATPFLNLTHAYGCDPLGALAHVNPAQHALAFSIVNGGTSSAADLMYFANDGGIYRALNGFSGLTTGSCSGSNQFDDLNQNLGSMTEFVGFSQSTTNAQMFLGGTGGTGTPATVSASSTDLAWGNILNETPGDFGYTAIDSTTGNWFAAAPDAGFGSLAIEECSSGIGCNDSLFGVAVGSSDLGGDDGAFYFPYLLDSQSTSTMLVGTCRVWSGPRAGGAFTDLSPNFDTLGVGTCSGSEINIVRALAAGGPGNTNGSQVIYATTDGPGPSGLGVPVGGNVWVTTDAVAVNGTSSTFTNTTLNGPGGSSINPNQFPVSSVAIDASDPTGNTAYITVMGFTGGPGHLWQTTNAGASWVDFTAFGVLNASPLPDGPTNAVVVDPVAHMVYAGTDVGVFQSSTLSPSWTEVGPIPGSSPGFLPNVPVTALAIFNSGGQKLLRASTYGRGVWEYNLLATPDFSIAISNTPLTVFPGGTAVFNGTLTALNGYNNSVTLGCTAGSSSPPVPCTPSPSSLIPTEAGAAFTVTVGAGSTIGNINFNIQGIGTDPNGTIHAAAVTLEVVDLTLSTPVPGTITEPVGATSPPVSFQITAGGSFNGSVALSCGFVPNNQNAVCNFTPGSSVNLTSSSPVNATATVTVPAITETGSYQVSIQATASGLPAVSQTFAMNVVPNFILTEPTAFPNVKAETTGTTGSITISSADQFSGTVGLSCLQTFGANACTITPSVMVQPPPTLPATGTLTINGNSFAAGSYQVAVLGISGSLSNTLTVPFNVGDYAITGPASLPALPGTQVNANLTFTSNFSYGGQIDLSCDASALAGAQCALIPSGPITLGTDGTISVFANIAVPSNASAGTYTVNIVSHDTDSQGEPAHAFAISLAVQNFSLSAITSSNQTVGAGATASYNFNVVPAGGSFSSPVMLACSGAPAGSTCTVTPSVVTPGSSPASATMTVATTSATPQGNSTITVTATSGPLIQSATATLVVANTLQLAIKQAFASPVDAGANLTASITLTPNYSGQLSANCSSSLAGTQCLLNPANPISVNGAPATLGVSVNIPSNTNAGAYSVNVSVKDSSGSPSQSISLPFTVTQDYQISVGVGQLSQSITAGQSITYNLSIAPVGASYNGQITLSCSSFPQLPGSCNNFSPNPVNASNGAASVVMTVTTQASSAQTWPHFPQINRWFFAAWFGIGFAAIWGRRRVRIPVCMKALSTLSTIALLILLVSCGGGANGSSPIITTGAPITYTLNITGSPASNNSGGIASVTLIVN